MFRLISFLAFTLIVSVSIRGMSFRDMLPTWRESAIAVHLDAAAHGDNNALIQIGIWHDLWKKEAARGNKQAVENLKDMTRIMTELGIPHTMLDEEVFQALMYRTGQKRSTASS